MVAAELCHPAIRANRYEVAMRFQPYLDAVEPADRKAPVPEVIEAFAAYYDGEVTDPTTGIEIAMGTIG